VHCRFSSSERKCTSSSNTTLLGPTTKYGERRPWPSSQTGAAVQKIQEGAVQSKLKDTGRIWIWGFLAIIALAQFYVVRELLAAFAIFALGFAALALVVASLYMLQKSWEMAMARLAAFRQPVINIASVTNMASVGNLTNVGREDQKAA
jgi:hypothetical protein